MPDMRLIGAVNFSLTEIVSGMGMQSTALTSSANLIRLDGKLMLGQVQTAEFGPLVEGLLHSGTRVLVFDLSGLSHIDSTGIGRFIETYRKLAPLGGKMMLAGAAGVVRESFRVTKLDSVFALHPTVEAARAAAGC